MQTGNHGETHRSLDSWSPAAPDAALGDAAGEKKSMARRSTGLDYSSRGAGGHILTPAALRRVSSDDRHGSWNAVRAMIDHVLLLHC